MIKFDITKLVVTTVRMKSCTTALGGSIRVVDAARSRNGKEIYRKINVPMAIVRDYQVRYKSSQYLVPVLVSIVYYENDVVALERHPLGVMGSETHEGLHGTTRWVSESERNIDTLISPLTATGLWFFDGKFIYQFSKSIVEAVKGGEFLSANGSFRSIDVTAIQLSNIHTREKLEPATRTCLAFVSSTGDYAVTPPIWKSLAGVGATALKKVDMTNEDFPFDSIDEHLSVNLSFALSAGKAVGEIFGYDAIEPLNLPELMVRMKTVNLPNVPASVKSTFGIGMKFTHAVAWLIGLTSRTNTVEGFIAVRSLLKYLTTKGIFYSDMFDAQHVFRNGHSIESVEYVGVADAKTKLATLTTDEMIARLRLDAATNRRSTASPTALGTAGLYDAA